MGYDCTLHLVDEELLQKELVPRLKADRPPRSFMDKLTGRELTWPPTALDKRRRDAPQLWEAARKALRADPVSAARQICELGILFSSCELPFESARGIALSLWPLEPAPFNPELPPGLLGSPEEVLGDLVAAYPDLEGEFPNFFDGNGSPGAYIAASRVPAALQWVDAWLETLDKGQRRHYIGLQRVLKIAAQKGYAYWEATDLDVERIESDLLRLKSEPPAPSVLKHVLPFPTFIAPGRSGTLLAVSDQQGVRTAIFDLDTWPPRERARTGQYAISAARATDGRWAMVSTLRGQKGFSFDVRVYDENLNAPRLLEAQLDGKRIDAKVAGWSGERGIVFAERRVFIESGDRLELVATLPSSSPPKPGSVFEPPSGMSRLAPGTDILIWEGHGYERRADTFERTFLLDADANHHRWTSAPAGTTGFYFLSGRRLYESHRGGVPVRHAPFLSNIMEVSTGPEGTLLLKQGDNPEGDIGKIYFPSDGTFVSIAPDAVGESPEFLHQFESLHWIEGNASIVVRLGSVLWAIPWTNLRERAQEGIAPSEPLALLLEGPPEWEKLGDCYRDGVREHILYQWKRQPAVADVSKNARFAFTILADGALGESAGTTPSETPAEAAALDALRQAAPFRPLPEGLSSVRVQATLTTHQAPPRMIPQIPESLRPGKPSPEKPLSPTRRRKAAQHLLPGGPESLVELEYALRGAVSEPGVLSAVKDILGAPAAKAFRIPDADLERSIAAASDRFRSGAFPAGLPVRPPIDQQTYAAVVARARRRRREVGAFMLGNVLARTETSTPKDTLTASMARLAELAARLEGLAESAEPEGPNLTRCHQAIDELESTSEATIVEVEQGLHQAWRDSRT